MGMGSGLGVEHVGVRDRSRSCSSAEATLLKGRTQPYTTTQQPARSQKGRPKRATSAHATGPSPAPAASTLNLRRMAREWCESSVPSASAHKSEAPQTATPTHSAEATEPSRTASQGLSALLSTEPKRATLSVMPRAKASSLVWNLVRG